MEKAAACPGLSPVQPRGPGLALIILAATAAFLGLLTLFYVGFMGSDDSLYWIGAGGWLTHFPYIGDTHWTLRHPLVIPMAIARHVLGDGMPALLLPSILYAVALLAVVAVWTHRAAGTLPAAIALLCVITNPQFVLISTTANIDVPEAFFVLLSFCLLHRALSQPRPNPHPPPSRRRPRPGHALP